MEEERFDRLDQKVDQLTVTVDKLGERVDKLAEKVDQTADTVTALSKKVDQTADTVTALSKKVDQTTDNVTVLTETLTEFIEFVKDNVAMKSDITQAVAQSEHNMKSYIDDRLADQTAEIGDRINGVIGKQREFNTELIDGLESNKVFEADRIGRLKALAVNTASK
jgi:methyl-accepting chemotaxis protein